MSVSQGLIGGARTKRRSTRPMLIAIGAVLLGAYPAHAARAVEGLVTAPQRSATDLPPVLLEAADAPGFRPARTSIRAARAAVAAAVRPARLPLPPGRSEASHFVRKGADLWSVVTLLPSSRAAAQYLHRAQRTLRRAPLRGQAVRVGTEAWLVGPSRSHRRAFLVWRRREAIGEILLAAAPAAKPSPLALDYATLVDARLARVLRESEWQRLLERVRPDGSVSRATALRLFALSYGPLPGVAAPRAGTPRPDEGTLAGSLLLRRWSALTPAQRAAAGKLLGVTAVQLGRSAWEARRLSIGVPPNYGDPTFQEDAGLEAIANEFAEQYAAKMHHTLRLKIVAGATDEVLRAESGGLAWADAYPVDAFGTMSNGASYCRIRVTGEGAKLAPQHGAFERVIAHEVFHCFEFELMTPTEALLNRRNWLLEGAAEWASLRVVPLNYDGYQQYGGWMSIYLNTPYRALFTRTYDAVGFFAHAEQSTGDLFARMGSILRQSTSPQNFDKADGNYPLFLDSWAASTYNDTQFGTDFTMTIPFDLPKNVKPSVMPIWGSGGQVAAEPYTMARYRIDRNVDRIPGLPLLHVRIGGHARLVNGALDTTALEDAYFCMGRAKDCKCPRGEVGNPPPAPPLENRLTALALSANGRRTAGLVTVEPLSNYCKRRQEQPAPPHGISALGGGGNDPCRNGCGFDGNDPHLTTFDGSFYDFQGAGEYILARSRGDLEVQAREQPYPGSDNLAINTAVAMRVAGDRVVFSAGSPLPTVRVNGRGFPVGPAIRQLPGGGHIRLFKLFDQMQMAWPDGTIAGVWTTGPSLNVLIKPAPSRRGTFSGLLGNWNGKQTDDFRTRSGKVLNAALVPTSLPLLYHVFGDSWRVRPGGSLFDYGPGQSTRTYTKRNFPADLVFVDKLARRERDAAEAACKRMGITDRRLFHDCVIDVAGTGDYSYARGTAIVEHTAGAFGRPQAGRGEPTKKPSPPSAAQKHWTPISGGGNSSIIVPSLAVDRGKVVAVYQSGPGSIEAATFSPSVAKDAAALRRDSVLSGWNSFGNLSLLEGGGLQLLVSGIHTTATGDPLTGENLLVRNPDGSFGPPRALTGSLRAGLAGAATLAPDGNPFWAAASGLGFWLWRGAQGAEVTPALGSASIASVGRDDRGRYWLAWYALGSTSQSGLRMVQVEPSRLAPIGQPQTAPDSRNSLTDLGLRIAMACAQTCRIAYVRGSRVVSWTYGEGQATTVASLGKGASLRADLAAAYTAKGRLWVAWYDTSRAAYGAALGNSSGAGGRPLTLGRPTQQKVLPGALAAVALGEDLVLLDNWPTGSTFTRYANVVAPG